MTNVPESGESVDKLRTLIESAKKNCDAAISLYDADRKIKREQGIRPTEYEHTARHNLGAVQTALFLIGRDVERLFDGPRT